METRRIHPVSTSPMRGFQRLGFQPLTFRPLPFRNLAFAIACCSLACAAPVQRISTAPAPPGVTQRTPPREPIRSRPAIGVAFGGGSARGLAHVGVIRWFEEHRVPIDLAAGTSMGGLV